jgi:DNA-binding response OmpR family regulator
MASGEGCVVVIEDDHHISDLVAMYLRRDGFRVVQADDAERGLAAIGRESPRLVVVDIGLPGELDGLDVCKQLTAAATPVPVLILSARDDEVDRVLGLELGADDYMTKPFSARELVARVHAILRRTSAVAGGQGPTVVEFGDVTVDTGRRETRRDGEVVPLATREFDLLTFLVDNQGLALSRQQLLDGVWGPDWFGDARTVDVHVRQLRKKLGTDLPLATVWGVGYRLG